MIRIKQLSAENIGPFVHLELTFPEKTIPDKAEIHLFTGVNGTGKTTILEMLASVISPQPSLERRININMPNSGYTIFFNDGSTCSYKTIDNELSFTPNHISNYHIARHLSLNFSNNEYDHALFAYSSYRKIATRNITAIKEVRGNPMEKALDFNASSDPSVLIDWIANQKTKEALALMRGDNETAQQAAKTIKRIENIIERITDSKIKFQLLDNPLRVTIEKDGITTDFDLLPDGMKAIISWISDLLMRLDRMKWKNNIDVLDRNFILFLDEIDVHLHPAWQRKILPIVQDLFKNAQIFITTHSPFVVGSADGVWIHKLTTDGVNSTAHPPVLSENSKSYQLILDEIFDIRERFGVDIEEKLREFQQIRNKLLHAATITAEDRTELKRLVDFFKKENSIEIDNIIGSELRQLSRILKENFSDI
jgi:predicted ATP-binding protein involved in virulence